MPSSLQVSEPASRQVEQAPPKIENDGREDKAVVRTVLGATIFLGAFLLFFVQLHLGKLILPTFGGAPAVWTSCLMVFQVLLLLGYSLAHLLASRFGSKHQAVAMILILGTSLVLLLVEGRRWTTPITPGGDWSGASDVSPAFQIVRFLLLAIGVPFLILSTTSSLLQRWFSRLFEGASPYRLYALSNAGSLLGLLFYPFVAEPTLHLRKQAWLWTGAYILYACAYGFCAWKLIRAAAVRQMTWEAAEPLTTIEQDGKSLGWRLPAQWILLAGSASLLLLATTNHICQEVAVVPLLWVLPLSIYLASFILTFEGKRWYRRELFQALFVLGAGAVVVMSMGTSTYSYLTQLVACSVTLFAGCMLCHGEAAGSRPSPEHLTRFYLCISFGGALGGVFVSVVAPRIFPGYWEFPIAILVCLMILLWRSEIDPGSWLHQEKEWLAAAVGAGLSLMVVPVIGQIWDAASRIPKWVPFSAAGLSTVLGVYFYMTGRGVKHDGRRAILVRSAVAVAFIVMAIGLALPQHLFFESRVLARSRSFYGTLIVVEEKEGYRVLVHGITAHGFQFVRPDLQLIPAGYYGQNSGVNILLRRWPWTPKRVGVVGMGAGTLAALGQPGDTFRFYEINPDVVKYAAGEHPYFTFISRSKAAIEIAMGDARMSLAQEAARGERKRFDILVLDAFSSDAIPIHLLTREAFDLYASHLRGPESVIAVHISNKTLNLGPVLAGIAQEFGFHAIRANPSWLPGFSGMSDWVLLSRRPELLSDQELAKVSVPFPGDRRPILWTDEFSNLVGVLR